MKFQIDLYVIGRTCGSASKELEVFALPRPGDLLTDGTGDGYSICFRVTEIEHYIQDSHLQTTCFLEPIGGHEIEESALKSKGWEVNDADEWNDRVADDKSPEGLA